MIKIEHLEDTFTGMITDNCEVVYKHRSGIEALAHYIEHNPIYIKYAAGIVPFRFSEVLYSFTDLMFLADGEKRLYLEDYGIKWAKTREELLSTD